MTNITFKFLIFTLSCILTTNLFAAIYEREGFNFTDTMGDYNTTMSLDGYFETSSDIKNLPYSNITSLITSYNFSDGVRTLTENNSIIVSFSVETDSSGQIGQYHISIFQTPITNTIGENINVISTSLLSGPGFPVPRLYDVGFSEPCDSVGSEYCAGAQITTNFGQYIDGDGVTPIFGPPWNLLSGGVLEPTAVPIGNLKGLFLLALLFLLIGAYKSTKLNNL